MSAKSDYQKVPCDTCRGVYWGINLDGSVLPCPYCGHVGGPRLPPDYNKGEDYMAANTRKA